MSKNIILVDKRVQDYETIVAAIDTDLAIGVVFDYFEDTFEAVKARIDVLALTNANTGGPGISVGLLQHNYRSPMFGMVASADLAPVANIAAHDPDLMLWAEFRDFIIWCKTERGAAHFDLMACALYSDNDWKYVIDTLTLQTGVTIRASTDDTGSATLGGDWFLESHTGVNLKDVYFTESIDGYSGVLYLTPRNIRNYSTKGVAIGSVAAWGEPVYGNAPDTVANANSGVVAVYSTQKAFAALKSDGSVVAWGYSDYYSGGSSVAPSSVTAATNVVAVYSTERAFAALKSDGRVVAWGDYYYGGDGAPSTVANTGSGVVAVYSTGNAFAALKTDGTVVAWRGSAPSISGVVAVYSNNSSFAALKSNGSVVAWGYYAYGGTAPDSVTPADSGVVAVYSTPEAFAALKSDGSVVAWGNSGSGGSAPGSVTLANSHVVAVYSNNGAFAALKTDGSVVAWGSSVYGGTGQITVASGVVVVYSTAGAFAALKTDGSVVAWGISSYGRDAPDTVTNADSGVVAVYSNTYAFAALKNDGRVVVWGSSGVGGNGEPESVTNTGSGVVAVYSTERAFAALKSTASTFDLNMSYYTDMDRYNILRKKENRRRVNLTTLNNNVFTLSQACDIQSFNRTIPTNKTFRIVVPAYTSSPLSITSSVTIPSSYNLGSVIIACDESEPVSISGTTYINYGSFVYTLNVSGSYIKTNSATINGLPYSLYGGDGINSSGIALLDARQTSTLSTFTVDSQKIVGDEPFAITRPTSNSDSAITYSSSNTAVATIDASGDFITVVGGGDVSFIATQEGTIDYAPTTKTSNTLSVMRLTSTFSAATFEVESPKTYGDAPFAITTRPTSNSSGAITYSSSNTAVATIDASGNFISLVAAGQVSFIATQAQTSQYESATNTSNTLTVELGTSNLSSSSTFTVASIKIVGDASFAIITRPTSNSSGEITYSSSNPAVATIDASGNFISLIAVGDVSFIATQAETSQYASATKTSNTLAVRSTSTFSAATFEVESSKTYGDASFNIITAPTSNSDGAITYSSSNTAVATIDASGNFISLVAAGEVSFIATQAQTSQYVSSTNTSNTLTVKLGTSNLSESTFEVESSKTYGAAPFAINTPRPTSNSTGVITYSSSNTAVATIDASGNFISLVGAGSVSFIATQAQTSQYASATKTSNTLTVALGTSNLSSSSTFTVASSKMYGDAPFAINTPRPASNSGGAITYSSSNTAVATIDASGNFISLVGLGQVSFIATQAETSQYESATKTSNTLTVSKGDPILAFVSPPTSKNMSEIFTVTATSASSGAVTYTSSNTSLATVGLSTGLVRLKSIGTVTITAAQALSALYNAPANTTCSIVISAAGSALSGQTVSPGTTYDGVDFSGAILTGSTLSGVSFSGASLINTNFSGATIRGANFTNANITGASLINADLSGAVITGTEFTNANINGATNLPVFSTVQKLQLLKNINNIAIGAIQINSQVSGADINAMLPISVFAIASATFTVKAPTGLDASSNKIVTISDADISNNTSVYVPLNANETVKINGTVFSFNGTNLFDVSNNPIPYLTVEGVPFRIYVGSVIALNMSESLNEVKIMGDGVYNIIAELFASK